MDLQINKLRSPKVRYEHGDSKDEVFGKHDFSGNDAVVENISV